MLGAEFRRATGRWIVHQQARTGSRFSHLEAGYPWSPEVNHTCSSEPWFVLLGKE